jgi:hypothetical protein
MSKGEKKEQRIRKSINNVSLEDFEALINRYGKIIEGGSHPKAYINDHVFAYKRHNPVSAFYVEAILRLIDEIKGE